jgi:hypothetical protein
MIRRLTDGCSRTVFLVGRYAVKAPVYQYGIRSFLRGWATSSLEAETWRRYPHAILCPVVASLPWALAIVMPRAEPLDSVPWLDVHLAALRLYWHAYGWRPHVEYKRTSYGRVGGKLVALDYGA